MFTWLVGVGLRAVDFDPFGDTSAPIGCAEALEWADARLPASAYDEDCAESGVLDTDRSGSFRMDRDEVETWLHRELGELIPWDSCPAVPTGHGAAEPDLCRAVDPDTEAPYGTDGPHYVEVAVVDEDADTALVRFTAFTV
ncbi:hypothetical protein AB0M28_12010 [Streptomyces sp. NPDC051940]|uniref:hypothetical protein n=1 Tax=Streptomyces sp. NPDC051940 TaxID=3155675 RepID=UPI0034348844